MTRKIATTTKMDECHFDPNCPFDCPLNTCVKEYPGGIRSFNKDKEFLDLIASGMDMYAAGDKMGIKPGAVQTRYNHAVSFTGYQTSKVPTA